MGAPLFFVVHAYSFYAPPFTHAAMNGPAESNLGSVHDCVSGFDTMTISGHRCTLVRLRPQLKAQHPSIPSDTWHPVLPCNPKGLCPEAKPGSVWVDVEGRVRHLPTKYFEFTDCLVPPHHLSPILQQ